MATQDKYKIPSIAISVVVPLYNKGFSVVRAIESILEQDLAALEIIVVDDGSTDDGVARVQYLCADKLRIIQCENGGVSRARNRGIREAKADYVAFLDADDQWSRSHLADMACLIQRHPEAGVYATAYLVKESGRKAVPAQLKYTPPLPDGGLVDSYYKCIARGHNPVWSSAVCIPKSTFTRVGLFPEGVRLYEDLHMWTRIALEYPIAYCPKPSAIYHKDAENRACVGIVPTRNDMAFREILISAKSNGTLQGSEEKYAQEFINRYALMNGFKAAVAGEVVESRAILRVVRPRSLASLSRMALIYLLSFLPRAVIASIWQSGIGIKTRFL